MQTRFHWRGVASVVVLAVGLNVVWAIVTGWGAAVLQSQNQPGRRYESLVAAKDGTPVIVSRSPTDWQDVKCYRLDRTLCREMEPVSLGAASFLQPYRPGGIVEVPLSWSERIGGVSSGVRPYASWYLVRDTERPGRGYAVGYDVGSGVPFAYAGKQGVLPTPPDKEDWFELGEQSLNEVAASLGNIVMASHPHHFGLPSVAGTLNSWKLYLKDGDQVVEVDMRQKKTRTVGSVAGFYAMGILDQPRGAESDDPAAEAAAKEIDWKRKSSKQLALRTADAVCLLDIDSQHVRRFTLPEELRESSLTVYASTSDTLMVRHQKDNAMPNAPFHLSWIDLDGEVVREETVSLIPYSVVSQRQAFYMMAGVIPSPAMWSLIWTAGPLFVMQSHQANSYGEAFVELNGWTWPAMTVVFVVGLLLAAYIWQKHRRLYRERAALWTAVVFLLGPAGLIAYALHWRRPPMDACPTCNNRVPRDREYCPACEAEWPAPELTGREVFS